MLRNTDPHWKFCALTLALMSWLAPLTAEAQVGARWNWVFFQIIEGAKNPETLTRTGRATVRMKGNRISIEFIDARSAKGSTPPALSGSIDSDGNIAGQVSGFDLDFDAEPMFGEYRSHIFPGGCTGYEIVLRDRLPRGRVVLLANEKCPDKKDRVN